MSEQLCVQFHEGQREQYADQILKKDVATEFGIFSKFKKNSSFNKAWRETVWSHIDSKLLQKANLWWLPCVDAGRFSHSLWDQDGIIYGLLESTNSTIHIPEGTQAITLSEYYTAYEKEK